ncbi:PIN domain-containing protein [Leptolyngbya sp. NIES-2104]|uniref:PIN domain-containing protein n=1 Tax=Leptolyngbya sp. NIES-2104 TaxID=1552121 RepID=UPI00073EC9C6|nr:PIN domain-containing protein [Leptolyngbya sp. NIES-2104]
MVKVLLDTNVIVAALSQDHEMYSICKPLLDRIRLDQTTQGFISTHSLAECYSILTRMPPPYRVSPATADYLLTENLCQFTKISLTAENYQAVLQRVVQLNISGGGIYDALIAQAALIANVDSLLTFNTRHFTRLGAEVARLIQIPS